MFGSLQTILRSKSSAKKRKYDTHQHKPDKNFIVDFASLKPHFYGKQTAAGRVRKELNFHFNGAHW